MNNDVRYNIVYITQFCEFFETFEWEVYYKYKKKSHVCFKGVKD